MRIALTCFEPLLPHQLQQQQQICVANTFSKVITSISYTVTFIIHTGLIHPPDRDGDACKVAKDCGLLWLILTVDCSGDEFITAADEVICKLLVESGNELMKDSEEQIEQNK